MHKFAPALLLFLGLAQMIGDVLHWPALRALAAASGASPAPKVFSAVQGLETYSTRFFLEWTDRAGQPQSLPLTPEVYERLEGPYNRRNVYGAVLAYGPVLVTNPQTRPMYESVMRYALCGAAPLLRELGIQPETVQGNVRLRLEPVPGTSLGDLPRTLETVCP